jgi:hypothetical protein
MFEQIRDFPVEFAEPADLTHRLHADLVPPVSMARAQPEARRFEFPANIWVGMIASYVVFFAAIALATGGSGHARFAIVISIVYTAIYFGVGKILARQAGPDGRSPLLRGAPLQTWCGPMDARAVYGQVLVVPMAIAAFGIGIAVICAVVL